MRQSRPEDMEEIVEIWLLASLQAHDFVDASCWWQAQEELRTRYLDHARIWVFDEATSALDTESERIVQQSIEQWHGRKTLILIAHRLSTVRNADTICVMADGRVVESGDHAGLMARQGLYCSMVRSQALE